MALSVKPNFFPELWMMMGCRGLAEKSEEESLLGEESREEGSEEREYGESGLARGDTPNTSAKKTEMNHHRRRLRFNRRPEPMSKALSAPAAGETNVSPLSSGPLTLLVGRLPAATP